jgi:hypothetical protein
MDINLPDVVAEVTAAFKKYNQALDADDLDTLDALFWKDPRTLRYGPNGTLLGHAAISAFRRGRRIKATPRALQNTVITTFGRDIGTTNTETTKPGSNVIGRQSQTWIRVPEGWRIVAAHVSDQPG